MAGEIETLESVGVETIDSVECLKILVSDAVIWLAQDACPDGML